MVKENFVSFCDCNIKMNFLFPGVLEGDEILSVNNREITGPENGLKEVVDALLGIVYCCH